MNYRTAISFLVAAMLALTSVQAVAGQGKGGGGSANRPQQMDQDRMHDRDGKQDRDRVRVPDQDRDQDRQRAHLQDPMSMSDAEIYGSELMTAEERNHYRKQLKTSTTAKSREQYQLQHEAKMQQRALQQGKDLVPPGQGPIYGGELMTVQERNQYREQLRQIASEQEREKIAAQHQEMMRKRAEALQVQISEAK